MPISGNALAKYLVMVSQVIAWCTVSAMLLRRGLNQVNAVSNHPPSPSYGDDGNATTTAATDTSHRQHGAKSFDENGATAVVAGIIMIAIAVIMLIISPTIMVMKIIEKRKRNLETELESPPKYEDVVENAPRYSSLFVFDNDGEMALLSANIPQKDKDDTQKQLV